MSLQSHYFEGQPPFLLEEHLAQVKQAADFLLSNHHLPAIYPQTTQVLEAMVLCHDLGKGCEGFQNYIKDPAKYRGKRDEKNHAILSVGLAILWAKQQGWNALNILALTQAVAGHHSGFRTLTEGDKTLDYYLRSDKIIEKQWVTLNYKELSQITHLSLESISEEFESARDWLFDDLEIEDKMSKLSLPDAITFRLWTQFLFSILLEADKALLALRQNDSQRYFQRATFSSLLPETVHCYLENLSHTALDDLRHFSRKQVMQYSAKFSQQHCFTLTLPTGIGKTLLAASWALEQRQLMQTEQVTPKIIIVLPFLSIIDQTESIYRQLLNAPEKQSELLMASHSLALHQWDLEEDQNSSAFFLDTWRSEIVITTFDQFLLALFSPKTKYLMRFHHLMDALIILDEVQTLPIKLWDLVNKTLQHLVQLGKSRILLMSATQPDLLQPSVELAGEKNDVQQIFKQCKRYRIIFKHRESQPLDQFIEETIPRLKAWLSENKRPLITLNTRASAKKIWQALQVTFGNEIPVYLISADLIPRDRLKKINAIKTGQPCIVVSTQTIEAGVDIDMDVVIRDFAPLDALIQIAGRCNRNLNKGEYAGQVEIVSLKSKSGKNYANYIYARKNEKGILDATLEVLSGKNEILEEDILPITEDYFKTLKKWKDTGKTLTHSFAYWGEMEDVHSILRPKVGEQINFLVIDDEESRQLLEQLQQALKIENQWEKRRALQILAGDLNTHTVSYYKHSGFYTQDYIDNSYLSLLEKHGYAVLKNDYYDTQRGLKLSDLLEEDDLSIYFF